MSNLPLRDIHLPEPVGFWPLAPGWWLLIFTALTCGLLLIPRWRRSRTRSVIKLALRELATLETRAGLSPQETCLHLSILLRRVCLSLYPRERVAGLAGDDWLIFLDQAFSEPRFMTGIGRQLIEAPYRSGAELTPDDLTALLTLSRDWLQSRKSGKFRP